MKLKRTLCIIKPDAYKANLIGSILKDLEADFKIVKVYDMLMSEHDARIFYREHEGRSFFDSLVKFMSSGPCVLVVLEGPDAIRQLRACMGATDPSKAEEWTLRGKYGTEVPANAVHGSDSDQAAKREIRFFFGDGEAEIA